MKKPLIFKLPFLVVLPFLVAILLGFMFFHPFDRLLPRQQRHDLFQESNRTLKYWEDSARWYFHMDSLVTVEAATTKEWNQTRLNAIHKYAHDNFFRCADSMNKYQIQVFVLEFAHDNGM